MSETTCRLGHPQVRDPRDEGSCATGIDDQYPPVSVHGHQIALFAEGNGGSEAEAKNRRAIADPQCSDRALRDQSRQLGTLPRVPSAPSTHNRSMEIIIDVAADPAGRLSGNARSPELMESHAFSGSMEFLACIEALCLRVPDVPLPSPMDPPQDTNSVKGPLHD